jgi:hypothetical protein
MVIFGFIFIFISFSTYIFRQIGTTSRLGSVSVRVGGVFRGGRRGGIITTLPLAARATIVDLVDTTLLCLRREGIIPKDLLDFFLLLFDSIQKSARSTLGSLLCVGVLGGCLLEVAIGFIMAMDKPILFAMVGAPITIYAFLGFLGAAFLRGIALALLILLWDMTTFYCFSSFEISLFL